MNIRMSRSFLGPNGEQVEELYLVDADTLSPIEGDALAGSEEPASVFIGKTYVSVMSVDENGNQSPMPPQEISFPINVKTRKECFSNFEKSAKDYIQYLRDQEEKMRLKNNLYVPNAAEVSSLSNIKI